MLQHFPPTGQWTDEMRKTFVDLNSALISTPELDLLDYTHPLHLCATQKEGLASGLLVRNPDYMFPIILRAQDRWRGQTLKHEEQNCLKHLYLKSDHSTNS